MCNSIALYSSEVLLLRKQNFNNLEVMMRKSLKRICNLPQQTKNNLLHIYTNTLPLKDYALIRLLKISKKYENHFNEPIPGTAKLLLDTLIFDSGLNSKTSIQNLSIEEEQLTNILKKKEDLLLHKNILDSWFEFSDYNEHLICKILCQQAINGFICLPNKKKYFRLSCPKCRYFFNF